MNRVEWKIRQVSIKSVGSLQSWRSPVWSVGDSASLASLKRVLWEDNSRHEIKWKCLCLRNTRTEILSYFKRKENEVNSFSLTWKIHRTLGKRVQEIKLFYIVNVKQFTLARVSVVFVDIECDKWVLAVDIWERFALG